VVYQDAYDRWTDEACTEFVVNWARVCLSDQ
jgi:hypothetical protein